MKYDKEIYEDAVLIMTLLRIMRKRQDLTIETVAQKMGIDTSVVSRIEKKSRDPKMSTVIRYAKAINANVVVRIEIDNGAEYEEIKIV